MLDILKILNICYWFGVWGVWDLFSSLLSQFAYRILISPFLHAQL